MTTFDYSTLAAEITKFAKREIAPRKYLNQLNDFPIDLWKAMAKSGLMGISVPETYGGRGGDYKALSLTLEILADKGECQGVAASWMSQALITRLLILGHGNKDQKEFYLPRLASGENTICMAISEPGVGAHPKTLSTYAEIRGEEVVLNGTKGFLTNGPLADLFLVFAITKEVDGQRAFTTFIVPRETKGLKPSKRKNIDFLHPSPHCDIQLEDCIVPITNRIGRQGDALNAISLPMRRIEDTLSAAKTAGAMRHRMRLLCISVLASPQLKYNEERINSELGYIADIPDILSNLGWCAADLLDSGRTDIDNTLLALASAARQTTKWMENQVEDFINKWDIDVSLALSIANRDIKKSLSIAESAHEIQSCKRGKSILSEIKSGNEKDRHYHW